MTQGIVPTDMAPSPAVAVAEQSQKPFLYQRMAQYDRTPATSSAEPPIPRGGVDSLHQSRLTENSGYLRIWTWGISALGS